MSERQIIGSPIRSRYFSPVAVLVTLQRRQQFTSWHSIQYTGFCHHLPQTELCNYSFALHNSPPLMSVP